MLLNQNFHKESNFRDLGGYPVKDGRVVRPGCFYRSALPALMDENEKAELSRLGIKTILDLRTDYEAYNQPEPKIEGVVNYYRVSGMRDLKGTGVDYSQKGIVRMRRDRQKNSTAMMEEIYIDMMVENQAFLFVLEEWREDPGFFPLLFHCYTGKDRTGALGILLLMALGASRRTILEDFLYSNRSFSERIVEAIEGHETDGQYVEEMMGQYGVLKRRGIAMIEMAYQRYDTPEDFLAEEYGMGYQQLKEFRDQFLIKPEEMEL